MLAEQHQLSFELNVPDAASEITVVANLQRRSLEASMSLAAPEDRKGTKAKVNWLLRQLAGSDAAGIPVRARWPSRAPFTPKTLAELREDPAAIAGENRALVPRRLERVLVCDLRREFDGHQTFSGDRQIVVYEK